jgi:hypothetical protein
MDGLQKEHPIEAGREPRCKPAAIVVERAMYRSAEGVFWAAGPNAPATTLR